MLMQVLLIMNYTGAWCVVVIPVFVRAVSAVTAISVRVWWHTLRQRLSELLKADTAIMILVTEGHHGLQPSTPLYHCI